MIIFGHVRNDLTALKFDGRACLLASSSKNTFVKAVTPDILSMEGCYLMLDTESGDFVRSGKVVGTDRSFDHRHKEHLKRAMAQGTKDLESLFYRSYPSKGAPVSAVEGVRRGYFEDLELCCALGFSRSFESHKTLYEHKENQIFVWDASVLGRINNVKLAGATSQEEKQLHFVGYLVELCYDLALSPDRNVSLNPGFETPLGVFNNAK
jgi:hypothetical protein